MYVQFIAIYTYHLWLCVCLCARPFFRWIVNARAWFVLVTLLTWHEAETCLRTCLWRHSCFFRIFSRAYHLFRYDHCLPHSIHWSIIIFPSADSQSASFCIILHHSAYLTYLLFPLVFCFSILFPQLSWEVLTGHGPRASAFLCSVGEPKHPRWAKMIIFKISAKIFNMFLHMFQHVSTFVPVSSSAFGSLRPSRLGNSWLDRLEYSRMRIEHDLN